MTTHLRALEAVFGRPVRIKVVSQNRQLAQQCLLRTPLYDEAELAFLREVRGGKKLLAADRHRLADLAVRTIIPAGSWEEGAR